MQVVQTTDMIDVTFASVEEAVRILHGVAHCTPVLTSCQLDALSGEVFHLSIKTSSASAPSNS